MIILTRLNGYQFAVNPDLIERVQSNPDTTLGMIDGTSHVVRETFDETIALIRDWKASILLRAREMEEAGGAPALRVLPPTNSSGK